jgi:hypothetical protein
MYLCITIQKIRVKTISVSNWKEWYIRYIQVQICRETNVWCVAGYIHQISSTYTSHIKAFERLRTFSVFSKHDRTL